MQVSKKPDSGGIRIFCQPVPLSAGSFVSRFFRRQILAEACAPQTAGWLWGFLL
jgi:hypothetical protein